MQKSSVYLKVITQMVVLTRDCTIGHANNTLLPNSRFARNSKSLKKLIIYWEALYLGNGSVDLFVGCNAGLTLRLLRPWKMLNRACHCWSKLFLEKGWGLFQCILIF